MDGLVSGGSLYTSGDCTVRKASCIAVHLARVKLLPWSLVCSPLLSALPPLPCGAQDFELLLPVLEEDYIDLMPPNPPPPSTPTPPSTPPLLSIHTKPLNGESLDGVPAASASAVAGTRLGGTDLLNPPALQMPRSNSSSSQAHSWAWGRMGPAGGGATATSAAASAAAAGHEDGAQWVPEFLVWSDDMTAVVSQLPRQGLRFSGEAVRVVLAQGGDGEMKVMADLVGTSCLFLHHRKVRGWGGGIRERKGRQENRLPPRMLGLSFYYF